MHPKQLSLFLLVRAGGPHRPCRGGSLCPPVRLCKGQTANPAHVYLSRQSLPKWQAWKGVG